MIAQYKALHFQDRNANGRKGNSTCSCLTVPQRTKKRGLMAHLGKQGHSVCFQSVHPESSKVRQEGDFGVLLSLGIVADLWFSNDTHVVLEDLQDRFCQEAKEHQKDPPFQSELERCRPLHARRRRWGVGGIPTWAWEQLSPACRFALHRRFLQRIPWKKYWRAWHHTHFFHQLSSFGCHCSCWRSTNDQK